MARIGKARHGMARLAGFGWAALATARLGLAGTDRYGMARRGLAGVVCVPIFLTRRLYDR